MFSDSIAELEVFVEHEGEWEWNGLLNMLVIFLLVSDKTKW